jgi:hypothetical protein
MQVPRIQFTIRELMVAVAILAVLLGSQRLRERWSYCQRRAAYHDQRRAFFEHLKSLGIDLRGRIVTRPASPVLLVQNVNMRLADPSRPRGQEDEILAHELRVSFKQPKPSPSPGSISNNQQERKEYVHSVGESIRYHSDMKRRLRRAAWRLWLSIPPESLEP